MIEARCHRAQLNPEHSHPRGVTVSLADYDVESKTIPDNKVTRALTEVWHGELSDAVVHEVKNTGKTVSARRSY